MWFLVLSSTLRCQINIPPLPPLIKFSIFFPILPFQSLIRPPFIIFLKSDNESQAKAKTINAWRALYACMRAFFAQNFPPKIVLHNTCILSNRVISALLPFQVYLQFSKFPPPIYFDPLFIKIFRNFPHLPSLFGT